MSDLAQLFEETFVDEKFSSSERKALQLLIKEERPTPHELRVLRSKIFDIAREDLIRKDTRVVLDWLEKANKLLIPRMPAREAMVCYFSPGEDCLNAITNRIQSARHTLDICVFTISDDRISREIEYCHDRKVRVRILTDNDKLHDKGSDVDRLAKYGIPVRVDRTEKHMHHKFAIIDGKELITGSYNWTRSAERYNEENILITEDERATRSFSKEFKTLWEKMKVYD